MSRRPVITAEAILVVVGIAAFVAGISKRWVLDPLAEAFNGLSPNNKAIVATLVVAGVAGSIALARWRHRRSVMAARRVVESHLST